MFNSSLIFTEFFDLSYSFEQFCSTIKLGVTIARKVLPHPHGMKGSMQNLLNKGLFI